MACACFTRHCQSSCSVRDAPGLICQGCPRSVPLFDTPLPPLFGCVAAKGFTEGVAWMCGSERTYRRTFGALWRTLRMCGKERTYAVREERRVGCLDCGEHGGRYHLRN